VDGRELDGGEYHPIERSVLIDLGPDRLAERIDWPPLPPATAHRVACTAMADARSAQSDAHALWSAVDGYIAEHLVPGDPALEAALRDSDAAGLPPIAVTANQGKLLELLARIQGARSILELGTLGGYSTIWLARALPPGGRLITLEADPRFAALARANIARAGVADVVELRVGAALETLSQLHAEGAGPFDLIFIDADKNNYPGYFEWSLKLSRPGTVIVGDNVVRDGAILDPDAYDPERGDEIIKGVRRFYELVGAEPRVSTSATAIQTVGTKGHDGFALMIVGEE
jgi:predicted O-methyltransferase YrrM